MTFRMIRLAAGLVAAFIALLALAGGAYASFDVVPGSLRTRALNENGTIDRQAGSHPYEYIVSFEFKTKNASETEDNVRDIALNLPPGLVGDPNAVTRCTRQEFEGETAHCPGSSQVGYLHVLASGVNLAGELPLYSMVPAGAPLTLGASVAEFNVFANASVRTGEDYGVTVGTHGVPVSDVIYVEAVVWGVPAAPEHDPNRRCFNAETKKGFVGCASGIVSKPFLTLPTSCSGPLRSSILADSFENPGVFISESALSLDAGGNPASLTGCENLEFEPELKIGPETAEADTPTGLNAEVNMGQTGLEAVEGRSAADIKDTTVTLPEGMAVNPGQAAGLAACQLSQSGIGTEGPAECPNASKVGSVQVKTPLLERALEGDVYVLQSNPPNLQLLVAANDPADGIFVKLVGRVHLAEGTGQVVASFGENERVEEEDPALKGHLLVPQFPVSGFKLSFSGGAQAALTTPLRCGVYTTVSDFTPWSTPFTGDVFPSSSFAITSGPEGAPCPAAGPLPFAPSLIAGSTSDQAGGYTDFSLLLQRADDQQRVVGLQLKTPAGLLGMISHVPLCPEPQAQEGQCPAASQIGHTVVEAGPGPYPLVVPEPGQPPAPIYLTTGYKGAPYGLSIVVPLHVGPFVLETQKVRAKIEVDPRTAQLTVITDPLPQTVDGVPADLRTIVAEIDRTEFIFNPTNCDRQSFSGIATGTEGSQATISSPFGVGACRSLAFSPTMTATTSGKTSKANGASLSATLSYPTNTPSGTGQATAQANISKVKVELPKQLPSRLTTLQKACTAAQFNANPAGCPAASIVGHATVHTPVLPVPLAGPAYFVSHGGEAFPSLVVVLQGYGVTVVVEATTFISKHGVTSLTFKSAPDAPFSTFTLTSPQGPHSALAANGNLCTPTTTATVKRKVKLRVNGHGRIVVRKAPTRVTAPLTMPTELVAQNGAVLHENVKIAVTGCPTIVRKRHARAKRRR